MLGREETVSALKLEGDMVLGLVIGHDDLEVRVPLDSNQFSDSKLLLPRHIGVLGTTGGGKSTTVSHMIDEMQQAQTAVVLFDTEGEYTTMNEPTEQRHMIRALNRRKLEAHGVENTRIVHLVGRETSNPNHPDVTEFTLRFEDLTPYAVTGILDFNEAQQQRYIQAYELAKRVLLKLKIYPLGEEQQSQAMEIDDFNTGYPKLTLSKMYDIVRACQTMAAKEDGFVFSDSEFKQGKDEILALLKAAKFDSVPSWRVVQGRLNTLKRLKIFDNPNAKVLDFNALTQPGTVTIVDLSGTDSTQVNNLVIASLLRGLLEQQEKNAQYAEQGKETMRRVAVVIEEAHEFLSAERVKQMPELFQQVARIARRGRKRWLGLVFVTQLPQHLPDEVLGLINSYVLHKIGDSNVIARLKRSVGGVEDGLWNRLPNLAPGQAIIATPTLARALLVAMDPTPCKLRLVD